MQKNSNIIKAVTDNQPKVALYARLSQEDRDKVNASDDSESIKNQKSMLEKYAIDNGWTDYTIYSDDDFSGTDHSRPEFNRLIDDVKRGNIQIVVCKSMSRFTRDSADIPLYIYGLFHIKGVRFIGVTDHIDTFDQGNKKSVQITALINEWYLEDNSKNIKAVRHNQQTAGLFVGAFAAYGYKKDPDDKHHLIIDEPAAAVVRRIFQMYIDGLGRTAIARILNKEGVLCPSLYKKQHGFKYSNSRNTHNSIWRYFTITDILFNEVYIGNTVQNRTHSESFKTKKLVPTPKNEWIRVENTHEAIIDRKTWDLAHAVAESRHTHGVSTSVINIFSGKLICGICGGTLGRHKSGIVDYRCNTHRYDEKSCEGTRITYNLLYNEVYKQFKAHIDKFADPEAISNSIKIKNDIDTKTKALNAQIADAQKGKENCIAANKRFMIQLVNGEISETYYKTLTESFESDIKRYDIATETAKKEIALLKDKQNYIRTQSEIAKEYLDCKQLDNAIVNLFIDKIEVMPSEPYSKKAHLKIYWKF